MLRPKRPDLDRVADPQAPGARDALLEDDAPGRVREIVARHDRIAARAGADLLDDPTAAAVPARGQLYARVLIAQRVRGDAGERGDAARDPAGRLRVEPRDHVGQVRGAGAAREAGREPVSDRCCCREHRGGHRDPHPDEDGVSAPGAHAVQGRPQGVAHPLRSA